MRALALAGLLAALTIPHAAADLPEPTPAKLPRWRGFNLLEKFTFRGRHEPFLERDFQLISELGFNFVRLPMDYRGLIADGDWEKFDETALAQLDQAVEWGGKYGVHVCFNLHRAPGWTVAKPPEPTNLWTDPEPRRVAALQWGTFARRYRGLPNSRLSFNLFNEPAQIEDARYVGVVEAVLAAIRAEDPFRLVLCDGAEWGSRPVDAFIPLQVAMMTRGYRPMEISHFRAGWIGGSDRWPVPTWPLVAGTNGALLGPAKGADARPLQIAGPIPAGATVKVTVATVSSRATIALIVDGAELQRHQLVADPADRRWQKVTHDPQWNIHRAEGALDLDFVLANNTRELELRTVEGDWLALSSISLTRPQGGPPATVSLDNRWTEPAEVLVYQPDGPDGPRLGALRGREWLEREAITPWRSFTSKGGGVMVGEWGAFNATPHHVVLRWAEDNLRNWQAAGWGWALWNFRGPFGILDSERKDVAYEPFHGHQLDRKLLQLLQAH